MSGAEVGRYSTSARVSLRSITVTLRPGDDHGLAGLDVGIARSAVEALHALEVGAHFPCPSPVPPPDHFLLGREPGEAVGRGSSGEL
jgi:hypothetical protein